MINGRNKSTHKGFSRITRNRLNKFKILNKRQRLIVSVILLSLGLFITEYFLGKSALYIIIGLSVLTDILLFLSLKEDLQDNFWPQIFILPFFYSLAFGLFYFLVPVRLLTRIIMTSLYALGLYSLFLSENIFTVSAIRTIALLSSARTVVFTLTLLSFFFLANVIFTFHINVVITLLLIFGFSFPLILNSIWIYSLERKLSANVLWVFSLSLCLFEVAILLWFWPSSPTVIALFLTGIFYSIVGLSQAWFEKRLFKSVIVEYAWVALVVFIVLVV
ncbi:MAG: hypothetical protein M1405_01880, partial [Patescibacteria group bacterium]|nr:hypothetical protein [Patescibacteria group bacterium]